MIATYKTANKKRIASNEHTILSIGYFKDRYSDALVEICAERCY